MSGGFGGAFVIDQAPRLVAERDHDEIGTADPLIVPIGVDVPLETVRHLAFGPMIRVHWLRGDRPVGSLPGQTFGLLDQSTTRVVVGAVVRAFW